MHIVVYFLQLSQHYDAINYYNLGGSIFLIGGCTILAIQFKL